MMMKSSKLAFTRIIWKTRISCLYLAGQPLRTGQSGVNVTHGKLSKKLRLNPALTHKSNTASSLEVVINRSAALHNIINNCPYIAPNYDGYGQCKVTGGWER